MVIWKHRNTVISGELNVLEIDISYHVVEFECPKCSFTIEVLLKQIAAEEIVLCPGCLENIQLIDEGGSTRWAQRKIDESLADFEKQLRKFGR